MRNALLYGGIASFVLVLGLLLATPASGIGGVVTGGINVILSELPGWLQNFFLLMVIVAFFSCGTAVQGAGAGSHSRSRATARCRFQNSFARSRRVTIRRPTPFSLERSFRFSSCYWYWSIRANPCTCFGSTIPRTLRRVCARIIRDVRNILSVLSHRLRSARGAPARMETERSLYPGMVGPSDHDWRCALPRSYASRHRLAELALERTRGPQIMAG